MRERLELRLSSVVVNFQLRPSIRVLLALVRD